MDRAKVSVYINPFAPSAAQEDVLDFVQPFKPIEIRLRSKNNDPRGAQVAFVDFADEATALSLIAQKNFSRFMGQSMRLRLAFANQNNGNNSSPSTNGTRSFQENRSSPQSWNNPHRRTSPKERSRLREIQMTPREVVRGNFKIIASVNCTHFVALESGWQSDMEDLAQGLEDFANFAKCGVDKMDPAVVYACKEPETGKWRRCRKVGEEGDALVVELIDLGGPMVVTKDQVLFLSQLYKDWSIKSVDVFFDGYLAASGSNESFKRIEEHLLNKTFQLSYLHERTGPLMRDCVRVQDMKLNGESVLDELVQKGLLLKRQPPQEKPLHPTSTPQRPITKAFNTPRTPLPNLPLAQQGVEHTPSHVKQQLDPVQPMNVDVNIPGPANTCGESNWGDWNQQSHGSPPQNRRSNQQSTDGWGSVGLARDDIGTEVWNKAEPVPTAAHTEGWTECGNETPVFNRTSHSWNTHDWSASPPKKASAVTASQPQTPAACVSASRTASPAVVVGNQSPAAQNAQTFRPKKCEDVFSEVDEWNRGSEKTPPKQEPSTPSLERLAITEDTSVQCLNYSEPSLKLQTMEKLVAGRAVQQMISDRIAVISAELNKLKMHITSLSLMPTQPDAAMTELRHHRRKAQICTQDLEEIIQLASSETLDAYHLSAWAQFVGRIWSPMMNLLFFNEQPLCVYQSSVIRRAELDLSLSFEDEPEITVILERAIDPPKIFKFAQDLMTHKATARVYRVFFSEDNSKSFIILACPGSNESLEDYGRRTVDYLLGAGIIQ